MAKDKIQNSADEKTEQQSSFSMNSFLQECAAHWKWFVVSLVCFLGIGVLYILRQQPAYQRSMQVLIKDQDSGGGIGEVAGSFSQLGLFSTKTNVYNEMISLMSPAVMQQVVLNLHLRVNYTEKGTFHGTTLFGTTAPYIVDFEDMGTEDAGAFRIDIAPDGSAKLYKISKVADGKVVKYKEEYNLQPGFSTVKTPLGRITFKPNPIFDPSTRKGKEGLQMYVNIAGLHSTTDMYTSKLNGDLADRDSEVIDLSLKDVSTQRAVAILDNIVTVYNQIWVEDKNKMAVATSKFIDDRIAVIQKELGEVDVDIAAYKSKTQMPDLEEAAKLSMATGKSLDSDILEATNELAMAKYVQEYVNNPANAKAVIPVNTGATSPVLEQQINNYNMLLLTRNNLAAGSSERNPVIADYDVQLAGQREAISRGIGNQVAACASALRNIQGAKGDLNSQLASAPKQALDLLTAERQQKVKEELFLYLLQKREENELSQTFTANNTRVITPPTGPLRPVSPKKSMIMLAMLLAGLAFPAMAIYVRESTNTKVRSRRDLERMSTPFVGEIPYLGKKKRFEYIRKIFSSKKKDGHRRLEEVLSVVRPGSRDIATESFRIVRGSISLMQKKDAKENIIMLTSFNPGSGKSFIAFNLSASFAVNNKRVLNIDCDLRHGSTSQFVNMPGRGINDYLNGKTDVWRSLVKSVKDMPGLDILPIGHRPPNPAELLDNGRIGTLLKEASAEYDYVILDCPPVDIVVDTRIVEKYVNRTIFVVRAGLLERAAVADIDALYNSDDFKNMSLILNGTDLKRSRYGAYGSSYYGSDFDDE